MTTMRVYSGTRVGNLLDAARPIITDVSRLLTPHCVRLHSHLRGQLISVDQGPLWVDVGACAWYLLAGDMVCIPAERLHTVHSVAKVAYTSLFFDPTWGQHLALQAFVATPGTAFRNLLVEAGQLQSEYSLASPEFRLSLQLIRSIAQLEQSKLVLPLPTDRALRILAQQVIQDAHIQHSVAELAVSVGLCARTLERRFQAQTGFTFGFWRQRLITKLALTRLRAGNAVTTIAYDMGYSSPASFSTMFKRQTGYSPRHYRRVLKA